MIKNVSKTVFHRVDKVNSTQQLTKISDFVKGVWGLSPLLAKK